MSGDKLQGAIDLLALKVLARGPLHGFGITARIQQISGEILHVEEGSLYPALHRMERKGWIRSEWRVTENHRRAKFYRLTPAGRKRLAEAEESWERVAGAVAKVLRFA